MDRTTNLRIAFDCSEIWWLSSELRSAIGLGTSAASSELGSGTNV